MKRIFIAALTGLVIVGASGAIGAGGADQRPAEKAGDSRTCLDHSQIASSIVEDERTIRFEMLGRRVYRNRLSAPCPGLRQVASGFAALSFDLHGSSICRNDIVRVLDPARGGNLQTATICPLGSFERLADRVSRRR